MTGDEMESDTPTLTFRFFKWLLFAVEIFLLWVLCNTLFLVPGPYKGERGVIIIVAALLAGIVAWGSGKMFGSQNATPSTGKTLTTPPAVICIFVLVIAAVVMVVAILANR
jgi:hypothetical protein